MRAKALGFFLLFAHFAADLSMGGGHLLIDAALWLAVVFGLGKAVSRWWERRHTSGMCCVHGHH